MMMYQVKFTTTYKKSYKLMKKRGLDLSLLDEVVDLQQNHVVPVRTLIPSYPRHLLPRPM